MKGFPYSHRYTLGSGQCNYGTAGKRSGGDQNQADVQGEAEMKTRQPLGRLPGFLIFFFLVPDGFPFSSSSLFSTFAFYTNL